MKAIYMQILFTFVICKILIYNFYIILIRKMCDEYFLYFNAAIKTVSELGMYGYCSQVVHDNWPV